MFSQMSDQCFLPQNTNASTHLLTYTHTIKPKHSNFPIFCHTHSHAQIIFPTGSSTDPVSGKRCVGTEFVDDIQKKRALGMELNPKSNKYMVHMLSAQMGEEWRRSR